MIYQIFFYNITFFHAYEQGIIQTFSMPGIGYSFVSFLSIVPDSYRRRVFFNYEKRIRLQSPPEKVRNLSGMEIFSLYLCQHSITHIIGDSIHCSNMSNFKQWEIK
jgi:hypothetical protein